jgi:putative toxin-antitoxin system antitoxin component (TIGR02293 family)
MALKAFVKKNEKNDILILRKKLSCSQEKLARIIGIAARTVSRWETNKSIPSALADRRIRELQKIIDKMDGVIKKGKEGEWLNTPNEELNNDTPLEVISRGSEGVKEVLELLHRIEWGIPV